MFPQLLCGQATAGLLRGHAGHGHVTFRRHHFTAFLSAPGSHNLSAPPFEISHETEEGSPDGPLRDEHPAVPCSQLSDEAQVFVFTATRW